MMIHAPCQTAFNTPLRKCGHCGMYWCPRCERWFAPPQQDPEIKATENTTEVTR